MATRNILDVRTVIVIVSLGALASVMLWSVGLGLNSTQSLKDQVDDLTAQRNSLQTQVTILQNQVTILQNQVSSLQNQAASLNTQLTEKQSEAKYWKALVTIYHEDITDLFEHYSYAYGGPKSILIR